MRHASAQRTPGDRAGDRHNPDGQRIKEDYCAPVGIFTISYYQYEFQ